MADKSLIEQMLESLVNDDKAKADELFHEYVVQSSREIYESLIDSELAEETEEEDEDEDMEEAASDEDAEEDKVDESADEESDEEVDEEFEDIAIEGDDEMDDMGGDPTDDLEGELDGEDDDMSEKEPDELLTDLSAIVDELQAKFDAMNGGDEGGEGEMDDEMKDDFDLETVREYVEKVAPAKMGDDGANTKSVVAGKNDMGGTTANILRADTANDGEVGAGSKIKGSSLVGQNPKEDNAGNINVPGGKAGNAFSKKEPGHGAEKKGAGENAENKQSLFRGRR